MAKAAMYQYQLAMYQPAKAVFGENEMSAMA